MRVPLSWLRDFAPIVAGADEIAATLDDLGLIVDSVETIGGGLDGVVVARVHAIRPHPDADKVRLVDVDDGSGELLQIVCGAWNFHEGDLVPLATLGAVLPGDFAIARRKLRGQWSNGMLCSAKELRLADASDDGAGIMILGSVAAPSGAEPSVAEPSVAQPSVAEPSVAEPSRAQPSGAQSSAEPSAEPNLVPGTPLVEALGIEPDVVFDLDVLANRPDALCIAGVARDLAARFGVPFNVPSAEELWASVPRSSGAGSPSATHADPVVAVDATDACDRFTAQLLTGVVVGPSPAWMQRRLTLAGMRPINNVVDVSNYVMLELGAPNHPYDVADLRVNDGRVGLRVRMARPGESLVTLDDVSRSLDPADCVITDLNDRIVGVGGVMGGAFGEIKADGDAPTTDVLLEMAHFTPMVIARTAKRLGLRTEASARFERGTDPEGIDRAVARFVQLAHTYCGATAVGEWVDVRSAAPAPRTVQVRPDRVNAVLGSALSASRMQALLEPLGFRVLDAAEVAGASEGVAGDSFTVEVPSWRHDATSEVDVIEEIGRHHGLDKLPRRVPKSAHAGGLTSYQRDRRALRRALVGAGLSEAWTSSLLSPQAVQRCGLDTDELALLRNPLVADETALRNGLLPGLLGAVAHNVRHRQPDVALFEVGRVFRRRPSPLHDVDNPPDVHNPPDVDNPHGGAVAPGSARPIEAERVAVILAGEWQGAAADVTAAVRLWDRIAAAFGLVAATILPPTDVVEHSPASADGVVESVVGGEDGPGPSGIWAGGGAEGFTPTLAGLHPRRCGLLVAGESAVGVVGEVDPDVAAAWGIPGRVGYLEIDAELLLVDAPRVAEGYSPISRFPSADLDLAFVVAPDVAAAGVAEVLAAAAEPDLVSVDLFDVYRTETVRSVAFRIRVGSTERTLTDDDLSAIRQRCIHAVEAAGLGQLRS